MLKRRFKIATIGSFVLMMAGLLVWQFGPFQAVFAVAQLSDPAKLATLGPRGANPRLNKIVYWLHAAETRGLSPTTSIALAQWVNWTREPRASLVRESLLRNLKIADELGLFDRENQQRLRQGRAGIVTKGPYRDSPVEIDHIVPYSLAKEAGNELANLEIMPEPLNRSKSDRVGSRQLAQAEKLLAAGLMTQESFARVKQKAIRDSNRERE